MNITPEQSLYDILELKPDASPQEIREAYLRSKAAFGKDSVALYTLIGTEEREEMIQKIEDAYEVLSSAEQRKEYDRRHGLLEFDEQVSPARAPHNKKIISIDRVPPMESSANSEALLIAPSTDFTAKTSVPPSSPGPRPTPSTHQSSQGAANLTVLPGGANSSSDDSFFAAAPSVDTNHSASSATEPEASSLPEPSSFSAATVSSAAPTPASESRPANTSGNSQAAITERKSSPTSRTSDSLLTHEIIQEVEWKGQFLRKIREARRISVEEMSNITKVSKSYLLAIEEENFAKLPAPVFMRGFVTQIAKVLRLPHDQVAAAYMARYYQSRPDMTAR